MLLTFTIMHLNPLWLTHSSFICFLYYLQPCKCIFIQLSSCLFRIILFGNYVGWSYFKAFNTQCPAAFHKWEPIADCTRQYVPDRPSLPQGFSRAVSYPKRISGVSLIGDLQRKKRYVWSGLVFRGRAAQITFWSPFHNWSEVPITRRQTMQAASRLTLTSGCEG